MIPRNAMSGNSVCRTCGTDISDYARYKHWTECSRCYWKRRFDNQEPIEDLLRRRSNARARIEALPTEIEKQKQFLQRYRETLRRNASWWRRLLAIWEDEEVTARSSHLMALTHELRRLEMTYRVLDKSVESAKRTKKKFLDEQRRQSAAEVRRQNKAAQHEAFCSTSTNNLASEFERSQFYIRDYDYRRGNAIDNYFRRVADIVLDAFDRTCVFCGTSHDLTFDHYGLSKNEGGNFALILADRQSIRLNIVVLCRGCNASKGQRSYQVYFSDIQRGRVMGHQQALLAKMLNDKDFLKVIGKWYR